MSDNPFDQNSESADLAPTPESNLEVLPPSALEALNRAEVDIAIATAKRWKRDIASSIKTCGELALRNQSIARTCNYAVPRGGKTLVGPSVHFARIVAYSWGNASALSRVVGCDRANAHLQGVFHDLQTNLRIGFEMDWPVQAPKHETPERWNDQMNLAKRAGAAVALRVAIFNVIPLVLFSDIAEKAKLIAIGEGKTFEQSRSAAIAAFKELGVTQAQIYGYLDRGGLESITTDDLILLHALLVSIKDRTMTVDELFGKFKDKAVKPQVPEPAQQQMAAPEPPKGKLKKRETAPSRSTTRTPPIAPPPAPAFTSEQIQEAKKTGQITEDFMAPEPAAEPPAPAPAPPPPVPVASKAQRTVTDQVRERLVADGYSEDEFLVVLQDFDLNRGRAKTLDLVPIGDLAMVLTDWDSVLDQLNTHREQAEFPI
jgi:hypothetical protein